MGHVSWTHRVGLCQGMTSPRSSTHTLCQLPVTQGVDNQGQPVVSHELPDNTMMVISPNHAARTSRNPYPSCCRSDSLRLQELSCSTHAPSPTSSVAQMIYGTIEVVRSRLDARRLGQLHNPRNIVRCQCSWHGRHRRGIRAVVPRIRTRWGGRSQPGHEQGLPPRCGSKNFRYFRLLHVCRIRW